MSKCGDVLDEAIVERTKGSRRGNAIPEVVADAHSWPCEFRHVAIETQVVDARGGQRHVLAQLVATLGTGIVGALP